MKNPELTNAKLERIYEAFQTVPYAHLLGLELVEVARGSAILQLTLRDDLKQNKGLLHGGALASLIDTAAAFAIVTLLEQGQTTVTVDLTIHYLRPLTAGRAIARARVLRFGSRLSTVSVEVTSETEAIIATALTTYTKLA